MIKWVVFDLGDVVLRSTTALPELAAILDVPPDRLTKAYFAHRRDYDLHTDATRFWTAVARDAGAAAPDQGLTAELVRMDDLGWSTTDPATTALMEDLSACEGVRLAVLSNAPSSMGRLIQTLDWSARFEHLLFSGDLGVAKPDLQIYRILLERLGTRPNTPAGPNTAYVPNTPAGPNTAYVADVTYERLDPGEVAFLDDRADNIAGAIEAGIHGFVFTGAERARADLRTQGVPV